MHWTDGYSGCPLSALGSSFKLLPRGLWEYIKAASTCSTVWGQQVVAWTSEKNILISKQTSDSRLTFWLSVMSTLHEIAWKRKTGHGTAGFGYFGIRADDTQAKPVRKESTREETAPSNGFLHLCFLASCQAGTERSKSVTQCTVTAGHEWFRSARDGGVSSCSHKFTINKNHSRRTSRQGMPLPRNINASGKGGRRYSLGIW